jgi:hypothetical protein
MKKIVLIVAIMTGLAMSASATLILDNQFTENGKKLQLVADESGNANVWNGTFKSNTVNLVTAGGVYSMANPDKATKKVEALALTSGIVTYEVGFSSWAMDNTATADSLVFKLSDGTSNIGINWGAKDATQARLRSSGTSGGVNANLGANSGTTLILRLVADLDAGSYTALYSTDGTSFTDFTGANGANGISSVQDALFSVSVDSGTQWASSGNADFADVDYITIDVIPEPATLGLVGAFGAGILFIRRRFMI